MSFGPTSVWEELAQRSQSSAAPAKVDLTENRWLTLETADDGSGVMVLFTRCPWTLADAGERGLRYANLRERSGSPIALGIWRDALVLSVRLDESALRPVALENAAMELMRFSDQCNAA
jgi:hypothetical protein